MTITRTLLSLALLAFAVPLASCVTVKPQQRAVLATPSCSRRRPAGGSAAAHAIDNREGSYGGGGVAGGGCGCN